MKGKRSFRVYIEDILEGIRRIELYVADLSFKEFTKDIKTIDAVVKNLEVIGEASKQIPEEIRIRFPEISWKEMSGMRDILIHKYFEITLDVIWKTIKEKLPKLKALVKQMLVRMNEE